MMTLCLIYGINMQSHGWSMDEVNTFILNYDHIDHDNSMTCVDTKYFSEPKLLLERRQDLFWILTVLNKVDK